MKNHEALIIGHLLSQALSAEDLECTQGNFIIIVFFLCLIVIRTLRLMVFSLSVVEKLDYDR
ncbi:hypothetical protein JHK82_034535 [Glycine max]|uniref:Uncharacterized protein n=2 Tax=Glycine subgen. Soja TaxID=1462606 RepID=A0A0R0HHP6_SOYBN|nr:hypothetical protein JHK87_034481 [Glycine soja]KAG4981294.1 hypothetical protein JHK85_035252 [Glycine max]KAG4986914.1 hypothetical protein JHK86_034605 [Glycine max]KAG5120115.1 hypothetical protein JHK82_034535 [Glycine max]KAG5141100.1 hypothetical protein JHK84_034868 [Glycine max]